MNIYIIQDLTKVFITLNLSQLTVVPLSLLNLFQTIDLILNNNQQAYKNFTAGFFFKF